MTPAEEIVLDECDEQIELADQALSKLDEIDGEKHCDSPSFCLTRRNLPLSNIYHFSCHGQVALRLSNLTEPVGLLF